MSRKVCPTCHVKCRHFKREPGLDIYGKSSTQLANVPQIPCSRCMRSVTATRFASHLEKCMGMGGRASSRAALQKYDTSLNDNVCSDAFEQVFI